MKRSIFILSMVVGFYFNLSAQQNVADTSNYKNLGEVLVSGYRLSVPLKVNPGSVTLVNTQVLSSMPRSVAVDEALRLVPGVRIDNQANGSRIHLSIRGQGILSERGLRGIKVIIDGIPVNDPTGFAPDLYDVDWSSVSQIEVLRGPSASLYGGGSNGGILNIKTIDGGDKPVNGTVFSSIGSNGFFKEMARVDGTADKLKYKISYSNFGGDGYRHHTAFRGEIFSEKMTWQPAENVKLTQLLTVSGYFNQNAEGLNLSQLNDPRQANPDAIPCNEYQNTKRITNGLITDFRLAGNQEIELTGYLKVTDYKEPGSSAVQYRSFITPGGSAQYKLNTGKDKMKNYLSAGVDFQFQNINEYKVPNIKVPARTEKIGEISMDVREDNSLLANQSISQGSLGVFFIDRMEFGRKINLMFSIRYDKMSNELEDKMNNPQLLSGTANFEKITARLGMAYNLTKSVNIYANIGQGYLPPATEELMNNPVSFGGFNKELKPATSLGEELGVRGYLGNKLFYDLTAFFMKTEDDFYRYRMPARPLETFYGNVGSSKRTGAEALLNWKPVKDLTFQLAYTWSDFKYVTPDSINGVRLPNSPVHQLYADAEYRFAGHFSVGISTELQSKWSIYTNNVNSDVFQEGFNLWHARFTYDFVIGKLKTTASLYGRNLTDRQYIAFTEPDPDGNSYQPSARREVFLSLKISF